jgi:hypothetical protein
MTNHFDIVIYMLSNYNPMEGFGDRRDELYTRICHFLGVWTFFGKSIGGGHCFPRSPSRRENGCVLAG